MRQQDRGYKEEVPDTHLRSIEAHPRYLKSHLNGEAAIDNYRHQRMTKNQTVIISTAARQALFHDVYQRKHIEACGVLIGTIDEDGNWHIEQVQPLSNIFDSPVYFEFAPEELIEAELTYPDGIVGVYHSHPTGYAAASSTDRQNMRRVNQEQRIPWIWLIVIGPFDAPAFFHTPQSARELVIIGYHHYDQQGLQEVHVQCIEAPNPIN